MSKYPRTYHLTNSLGATSDDKISDSCDSIIGIPTVITEKLDGSNSALTKPGVYARSHADFSRNPWDREMWNIWNLINAGIDDDVFLFGENMEGIHSIEYSRLESYFYMFGVLDNNTWLSWREVEDYSYIYDLPTVPVLFKGIINSKEELDEIVDRLVNEKSALGGEREGIVIINAGRFQNEDFSKNVMKWVRANHVQTDIHWTRNWKKAKLINR